MNPENLKFCVAAPNHLEITSSKDNLVLFNKKVKILVPFVAMGKTTWKLHVNAQYL